MIHGVAESDIDWEIELNWNEQLTLSFFHLTDYLPLVSLTICPILLSIPMLKILFKGADKKEQIKDLLNANLLD